MVNNDSDLQNAVLKLAATVSKLTDTVEKFINKDQCPDDDFFPGVGEEEGWETVRNTKHEEQTEMLDSWKDELNNLLVFAGLFSAVVTAFTVESYKWLQQDPGDASNTLLAGISLQLSAFTFHPTFLNSSSPALTLPEVEAGFSPVSYAVHVNMLWVLSLTFSLISAFFAIAVQQWLRQLRLPSNIPVQKAIQLLEIRSDALQAWQVPSIISLLPLLLQVAVILFLVGLFLLLRALNTTVAVVFGVVALIGLLAFLATSVTPLLYFPCPYKSPIVPSAIILLQTMSYPLVLAVTPIILCVSTISLYLPEFSTLRREQWTADQVFQFYQEYGLSTMIWTSTGTINFADTTMVFKLALGAGVFYRYNLIPYIQSFGRHMSVDMGQFWLLREYRYVDSQDGVALEQTSLASVLLAVPSQMLPGVLQCFCSFDNWRHLAVFQDTVLRSARAVVPDLDRNGVIDHLGRLVPKTESLTRGWISHRHRRLLWMILRRRDWTQHKEVSQSDHQLLTLFHQLDGANFVSPEQYVKHLLHVCRNQKVFERHWHMDTVPACLLLDGILNLEYTLDEHDVDNIFEFNSRIFGHYWSAGDGCRLKLAAGALSLGALHVQNATHHPHAEEHISALAAFLSKKRTAVTLQLMVRTHYEQPDRLSQHMSIAWIVGALCQLSATYSATQLVFGVTTPSISSISLVLREICSVPEVEGKAEMVRAREHLDDVDANIHGFCPSPGWELWVEGWDDYLVALAVAEDIENTRMEDIFEAAMEAFLHAESSASDPVDHSTSSREDIISKGYMNKNLANPGTNGSIQGSYRHPVANLNVPHGGPRGGLAIASAMPRSVR